MTEQRKSEGEQNQVPAVLATFTHQMRSIAECAKVHIAHAQLTQKQHFQTILSSLKESMSVNKTEDGNVESIEIKFESLKQQESFKHLVNSTPDGRKGPHSDVLAKSLLIFGFSTFDAFLGGLLRALFRVNPQLIYKLEEKSVTVADLLRAKTTEAVIDGLIESDISSLLRKSYDEVFSKLATRHGIDTLKKFDEWPSFIECSQRRNLITHCDGNVNDEYLAKCKAAEAEIPAEVTPGSRLDVSPEYLEKSLDLLYAVGVMLAHTLWRTASEAGIPASDRELTNELYELLKQEKWQLARTLGKFAMNLPKKRNDLIAKILRLNYAQSLKWAGDHLRAKKILDETDWSSSIRDLRLGVAVLREQYTEAAQLMRQIGKSGELVDQTSYSEWPIFRVFRSTSEFRLAFRDIYGIEFGTNPPKIVDLQEKESASPPSADTVTDAITSLIPSTNGEIHLKEKDNTNAD